LIIASAQSAVTVSITIQLVVFRWM